MRMKRPRPDKLPTEHRLRRLQTWLGALLAWAAVHVVGQVAPSLVADWLKRQRRRAAILLVVRATKRFRIPAYYGCERRFHRCVTHRVTIRRLAGCALRRALKAPTLAGEFAAIQRALADAERWIAHLLRRFAQLF